MNTANILYLNVLGLTHDKWEALLPLVKSYDLIFLAETWYIDQYNHLSHPFTLASTVPSKVYEEGRQHHGLLCLSSPSFRPFITSIRTSEFSISITAFGQTILAVYAPPSLSQHQFHNVLQGSSPPAVILGDINVRFGRLMNDTKSGPAE